MASFREVLPRVGGALLAVWSVGAALAAVLARAFDVLSHFAPIYLVAGVVAAVIAALWRVPLRRLILTCGVVAIAAGGLLMAPEALRPEPQRAPTSAVGQIKVIQFNAFKRNADIGRVADWLIAEDPDIVTLQEARHDLRDLLLKRTTWSVAGAAEHVMIFSREDRLRMVRPSIGPSTLTYVNATYLSSSGPFEVVTTHLEWPTSPRFRQQHVDLTRIAAALPRERMIVTGDFNTTPWSAALRRTDRALGLQRVDRALWSFPAKVAGRAWPAPVLPIDHVYAGPGWRVISVDRGPYLGSDHYPIVVTLAPVWPR